MDVGVHSGHTSNAIQELATKQLASLKGNIENGLGIFAGIHKKQWAYYFDELE